MEPGSEDRDLGHLDPSSTPKTEADAYRRCRHSSRFLAMTLFAELRVQAPRPLPQSSSASRFTAGCFGFLLLTQCRERPER